MTEEGVADPNAPAGGIEGDAAFVAWACLPLRSPGPDTVIDETEERRFELDLDWRLAGPNRVTRVRCDEDRVAGLVEEVRRMAVRYDVPILWTVDRDARPADLADRLLALGLLPHPHNPSGPQVMVRDAAAPVAPIPPWLTFGDALSSLAEFELTVRVQDAAFAGTLELPDPGDLTRRFANARGKSTFRLVRADARGEPAGAGRVELHREGALLGGGAVRPQFRGQGVYAALIERRRQIAVAAGARGLAVHGGPMSAPILAHLGFAEVGRLRDFIDPAIS